MGTSWISRKGGILEKGGGVDLEKWGYDAPLPTMDIHSIYILTSSYILVSPLIIILLTI